jgi:hypothetical protein
VALHVLVNAERRVQLQRAEETPRVPLGLVAGSAVIGSSAFYNGVQHETL